ncbi:MAG TPA: DEAD/DEAH box helicase [Tepidiformaceae bacterium]
MLDKFSPAARSWFRDSFAAPTNAQKLGWDAIAAGEHTLLLAPTGSGKTLAAFLWCLDRLSMRPASPPRADGRRAKRAGVSVLYISPLKALSYDVERNLRAPLAGLRLASERQGLPEPDITVAIRTGDTSTREREDIRRDPPDVLITTPESFYLMLTSRSREVLRTVQTVIVDEIHTMAGTKRGAHLSLSLERLEALAERSPQRIGLSATQRPLEEVARYLGGDRPVRIADAGSARELDLKVIVPVEDMTRFSEEYVANAAPERSMSVEERTSLWPAIYPELLKMVREHRTTLIFVNNRRLSERIAARINELAGEGLLRAHHGSVSREQRQDIEERLKAGTLPGIVCTSSLELGIDMGAIDLVIQVESPKSVASGMQRIGRSGHQVDAISTGRIFPKFRGDLLECAVLAERMHKGLIEKTDVPRNPLDVLAQQVVAMCAMDDWQVADLERVIRRSYNFASISRDVLDSVLGMLAGQYPSDEFADLKPRITWDRATDTLGCRRDAKTIAIVNAGTIPDRGLYGVFLGVGGPRVGELDEEMVYESRPGETFLLGASTWRIEQITRDQVIVSPAPGEPGKMPFWKGDGVGRPLEFGRAIGEFTRMLDGINDEAVAVERLVRGHDLDERAARNLLAYLAEEKEATGALPTDRTIVVERFRDELGDWRVILLTPFGGRVHAPWAQAIEATLAERGGFDVQTIWSDDGIAVRFAGGEEPPGIDSLLPAPEDVENLVTDRLADTALFAARFRENAGRALLLPRRRPGARSPLWLQRQRSANLLAVASKYGSFPIILETYRECLRDVFDLPGLIEVLAAIRSRAIRIASVETNHASPFARSLLFDYVAAYMYEGDAPLAERRAQALTLDRDLLRDLLGQDELRELLDPDALIDVELELQGLADGRKARNPDQVHDLLRRVGDLSEFEVAVRMTVPEAASASLRELEGDRRACKIRLAGEERWVAIEDVARYRDALGVSPPPGIPGVFLQPADRPLESLLARFARSHAPFLASQPAFRWSISEDRVVHALRALEAAGGILHGDFRPGGVEREWCDPEVLRLLRRRSLARLRHEVEPVDGATYARFLAKWHGLDSGHSGLERLHDVIRQVEGLALPASVIERDVLNARVRDYQPRLLDELGASGDVVWVGAGPLGQNDGRVTLWLREHVAQLVAPASEPPATPLHGAIIEYLERHGASFFVEIAAAMEARSKETLEAIWDLAWAGALTNDTFAPVRAIAWPKRTGGSPRGSGGLPAESAGRWSLVRSRAGENPIAAAYARVNVLLERYGVVVREAVAAENLPGGFSAIYPVLKAMEESGRVRRGYFIEGMGAAQFALPGAVDRLRAERQRPDEPTIHILAATDPANPYGAVLPWPRREGEEKKSPQRAAGAHVVLADGEAVLYVERGEKGLVTFPAFDDEVVGRLTVDALAAWLGKLPRTPGIQRIDGQPAAQSDATARFTAAGFVVGYRGLVYRQPRPEAMAGARGR